jgi:hypothetical protein
LLSLCVRVPTSRLWSKAQALVRTLLSRPSGLRLGIRKMSRFWRRCMLAQSVRAVSS